MDYCARCLYPANARPALIIDDDGVCSGCHYHESRSNVDWPERERMLRELLEEFKRRARQAGQIYDCIVPVSGGKDSHYQVHLIKVVYGLNPLLVTFNHCFNTRLGIRNLTNMVKQFGCDLLRVTANPESVGKIARHMVRRVGDLTWHYHAGIKTLPFQIAVRHRIPLIIWGEHGFAELTGMFTLDDLVEFTKWSRQEHDMRGLEAEDLIGEESGITRQDIAPYVYPTDDEIESLGVRGIYLSNFTNWDAKQQAELMIAKYDFEPIRHRRGRTFNLYSKTDDHANEVHDYMKYLKFGYGRATDDASTEIRHGRMTREEGIEMVRLYDAARPLHFDVYLKFLGMSEAEFEGCLDPMRDPDIWARDAQGRWTARDWVGAHADEPAVPRSRVRQVADRTLSVQNRHLYWQDSLAGAGADPAPAARAAADDEFIIL
jgi:N-acetyl sugar amidotransferase